LNLACIYLVWMLVLALFQFMGRAAVLKTRSVGCLERFDNVLAAPALLGYHRLNLGLYFEEYVVVFACVCVYCEPFTGGPYIEVGCAYDILDIEALPADEYTGPPAAATEY
jgi:hypothetical protein